MPRETKNTKLYFILYCLPQLVLSIRTRASWLIPLKVWTLKWTSLTTEANFVKYKLMEQSFSRTPQDPSDLVNLFPKTGSFLKLFWLPIGPALSTTSCHLRPRHRRSLSPAALAPVSSPSAPACISARWSASDEPSVGSYLVQSEPESRTETSRPRRTDKERKREETRSVPNNGLVFEEQWLDKLDALVRYFTLHIFHEFPMTWNLIN